MRALLQLEEKDVKVLSEVLPKDICQKVCSILNITPQDESSTPEHKQRGELILTL